MRTAPATMCAYIASGAGLRGSIGLAIWQGFLVMSAANASRGKCAANGAGERNIWTVNSATHPRRKCTARQSGALSKSSYSNARSGKTSRPENDDGAWQCNDHARRIAMRGRPHRQSQQIIQIREIGNKRHSKIQPTSTRQQEG